MNSKLPPECTNTDCDKQDECPSFTPADRRRWHVGRTIDLSHMLTTATFVITAVWYAAQKDEQIQTNANDIQRFNINSIQRDENIKARFNRHEDQQLRAFERIDDKLDRIPILIQSLLASQNGKEK